MNAILDPLRIKDHPLSADEAARVFGQLLSGSAGDEEIKGFLIALSARKPTTPEFVGAVTALKAQMKAITAPITKNGISGSISFHFTRPFCQ